MRLPSQTILPPGGLMDRAPAFGILSSFPPTACGLATFSAALAHGLQANGADAHVVRVVDAPDHLQTPERVVGLAVTALVQPVPGDLAGGRFHGRWL